MSLDSSEFSAEHEALMQFLYQVPVGLVQTNTLGDVTLMNAAAAQILMPLSHDGGLDNLFTALERVAPELRERTAHHTEPYGKICDGLHLYLETGTGVGRAPQILALTLLKLNHERVMTVINDITEQLRRDRRLRQNDAWFNAILAGVQDYALVSLDLQGCLCEWNPSIGRVTGFGPDAVGRPFTIFYPQGTIALEYRQDRLREADANGWVLDEGRRLRADGGVFWGSTLIAPLPDCELPTGEADGAVYCLILRDLGKPQDAAVSGVESLHAA